MLRHPIAALLSQMLTDYKSIAHVGATNYFFSSEQQLKKTQSAVLWRNGFHLSFSLARPL